MTFCGERWLISPQGERPPQTKGRLLSKSNWVDGKASGACVTLYCMEASWAWVTRQQVYHLEVPLGDIWAAALPKSTPTSQLFASSTTSRRRGVLGDLTQGTVKKPSLLRSCAYITVALVQVAMVMSNLQDTATQQRAKMVLPWQQHRDQGVQPLGGQ